MAVNSITFGSVNSATYGIYISGEGVFNAPKRSVEKYSIPGRNGDFILDNGCFENITVTYPAYTFEKNMTDFQTKLSNFRNALAAQKGYQRLTDTFHTDEYRMAAFVDGLDINPIKFNTASEFDITFECKPQRWLTSGETKVTVAQSGDTLTNPTLFEASPLLEIEGYGTLNVNGTEIELDDDLVGTVYIYPPATTVPFDLTFPEVYINSNDSLTLYNANISINYSTKTAANYVNSASINSWSGDTSIAPVIAAQHDHSILVTIYFDSPLTFYYGTPSTKTVTIELRYSTSEYGVKTISNINASLSYDGEKKITFDTNASGDSVLNIVTRYGNTTALSINSTATTYGHPTYIDCDLGEAYAVDSGGGISSLNSYIALGSQLPKLDSGSNTITFDNTITSLKVTPRWWKV